MADPSMTHVLAASSLGEVAWVDLAGTPRAAGVLPLVRGGVPVIALTLDRAGLATSLAAAEVVDLVVREPRNTAERWRPAGWRCRSRLVEDLEGEVYLGELALQELRRYPAARRYADSPLLAREHWWYLPRLVVELAPVAELDPPSARGGADDLLLVTADRSHPVVSGVRVDDGQLTVSWGTPPTPGTGTVFGQDASFPDLEVWRTWQRPADVTDLGIVPLEPLPGLDLGGPPGLRQRWRDERAFASACRRGIEAWQS